MEEQQVYEGEVVDNDVLDFFTGVGDVSVLDDSNMWALRHRLIQYNSFAKVFEFPLKDWAATELEALLPAEDLEHENGFEAGFGLKEITVAVLAINPELWERKMPDESKEYSAKYIDKKWRRRYLFYVYCREAGSDNPAIITVAGYNGSYLHNALESGRQQNMGIVKRITGGAAELPGPLMWITLRTSMKKVEVGSVKKKKIRPVVPVTISMDEIEDMDKAQRIEVLNNMYVGHEIRDLFLNGLSQEAEEWSKDQESRTLALVAQQNAPAQIEAPKFEVLAGGALYVPDLSEGNQEDWKEAALSLPGLFDNRSKAVVAFNGLMRRKGLTGPDSPDQWEAWREEVERLWYDKIAQDLEVARELEARS